MKQWLLFLPTALLAAQDLPSSPMPASPAAALPSSGSRSVLLIDPKGRAKDYIQAFELLRREKPALKVNIQTTGGTLVNVAEISAADNSTLLLIKVPFNQGTKYMIVPVEEVQEIAYSP